MILKKIQFTIVLILPILISAQNFGSKNSKTFYHDKINSIYNLAVSDISMAQRELSLLRKEADQINNPDLLVEVLALEAEIYRAVGDNVHLKLSYYQTLSWKNGKTPLMQKMLIKHLSAFNEGINKNYELQEKILLDVNKTAIKNHFQYLEPKSHYSLGKFYTSQSKYALAREHFEIAKVLFLKNGFPNISMETNTNLGINYFWEGKYQQALNCFHESKEYASKLKTKKMYANALLNLGEAHLFIEGQSDSAKFYLNSFVKLRDKTDIRDLFQAYYNLEEYFNLKKNKDSAYFYANLSHQVDNKIKEDRRVVVNQEIDLLYKKLNKQRKASQKINYQKNLLYIFAVSGGFLVLIIIIALYTITEKNKSNQILTIQKADINTQKNLIKQTLKEKDLLLKEIHHRVKNNLQIVSSLLSLKTKNLKDRESIEAIDECKERIHAIALIHQKLYLDKSFAKINMQDYLDDLLKQIGKSLNKEMDDIKILLKTNEIVLNIDTVVPLGLIVSELITNAFKYAFADIKEGKLKVEISEIEDDNFQLLVKDNGHGMQEGFNFLESKTLGVEIVQALTEQLEGELSYKSGENGTSIRIKFKELKNI
jgi:two-component sensor histidine kinase